MKMPVQSVQTPFFPFDNTCIIRRNDLIIENNVCIISNSACMIRV